MLPYHATHLEYIPHRPSRMDSSSTPSLESLRRTRSAPHVQFPATAHTERASRRHRSRRSAIQDYSSDRTPDVSSWRRDRASQGSAIAEGGLAREDDDDGGVPFSHSTLTMLEPRYGRPPLNTPALTVPPPSLPRDDLIHHITNAMTNTASPTGAAAEAEPSRIRPQGGGVNGPYEVRPGAGPLTRIRFFFGYGENADRARKAKFQFVVGSAWYLSQLTACITILAIAAHTKSPKMPMMNEWDACNRPLHAWVFVWLFKSAISMGMCYWAYIRDNMLRQHLQDEERRSSSSRTSAGTYRAGTGTGSGAPFVAADTTRRLEEISERRRANEATIAARALPHSALFARITMLTTLITLVWFLTAHVLEYTTINTCRFSAPHLWWLVFAIMSIMYVMVLEVLLLGFVVFVLAPVLFLFCNVLLLLIGRHPYQNPNNVSLRPEIGKLPKSVVDKIPLVIYIPPPPDADADQAPELIEKDTTNTKGGTKTGRGEKVGSGKTKGKGEHVYPPNQRPRKRFRFIRLKKKTTASAGSSSSEGEKPASTTDPSPSASSAPVKWEDNWEECEFPFVRIGGNRAVCTICLLDFEEPTRRPGAPPPLTQATGEASAPADADAGVATEAEASTSSAPVPELSAAASSSAPSSSAPSSSALDPAHVPPAVEEHVLVEEEPRTKDEEDKLKLADANEGDGPQPLRLLACGHAFHQTCVDPWLTNVSGRCPVCQQAILVSDSPRKKR